MMTLPARKTLRRSLARFARATSLACLLATVALAETPPPAAPAASAAATTNLAATAFMAGHWLSTSANGGSIEESWLEPKAGLMLGVNRSVSSKGRASFEYLRIEERADGIVYVASPGGGPATDFRLTKSEPNVATFENPGHDFPKRIVYRREGTSLTARVDDGQDGKEHGFELKWQMKAD